MPEVCCYGAGSWKFCTVLAELIQCDVADTLRIGQRNAGGVLQGTRVGLFISGVVSVYAVPLGNVVSKHSSLTHGGNYVYRLFFRTEVLSLAMRCIYAFPQSGQIAILNIFHWLIFAIQQRCVYCEVGTGVLEWAEVVCVRKFYDRPSWPTSPSFLCLEPRVEITFMLQAATAGFLCHSQIWRHLKAGLSSP